MYNILDITWSGLSYGLTFYMKVVSFALYTDNLISCSPFQIPFARLFIFKVNSVSDLKVRCRWSVVFCAFLIHSHQMFSWLWLVQDGAFPNLVIQNLGCWGIIAWVLTVGVGEDRDLFCRWGTREFHLWWGVELHDSWWLPGWCNCPCCPGHSHMVSWVWVLGAWGIPPLFNCFVGGMWQRKYNQCQVVWVHHPLVDFWALCHYQTVYTWGTCEQDGNCWWRSGQ